MEQIDRGKEPTKFTVAVCTYNQADTLRATLNSLNSLDVTAAGNMEILVVDNNSTDSTKQVCEEFARGARFPFRFCFESKQGLSHARNRAIQEAGGGVLVFTDDDVIVPKNWMQRYVTGFSAAGVDSIFGKIIPDWGGPEPEWFHPRLSATFAALDYGERPFQATSMDRQFFGANFACTVEALKAVGGFNTQLGRTAGKLLIGEETDVFRKLLGQDRVILYDPENLVHHVIRKDRKTKEYVKRYFRDIAESIVHMTDARNGRTLLGIPYYKYPEGLRLYLTFLPVWFYFALTGKRSRAFVEALELGKFNRTVSLFLRKYLGRGPLPG